MKTKEFKAKILKGYRRLRLGERVPDGYLYAKSGYVSFVNDGIFGSVRQHLESMGTLRII